MNAVISSPEVMVENQDQVGLEKYFSALKKKDWDEKYQLFWTHCIWAIFLIHRVITPLPVMLW